MDTRDDDAPTATSWWLEPDFASQARKFNAAQKVMGDKGLPPAIRDLLHEIELCDYHESSEVPRRRTPPTPSEIT